MSKGPGVGKRLAGLSSRKESRDCWEALALTEHREGRGLSGGLPQPVPRALNSHVLHQLLQVLNFKVWTHNRWDTLAHLHEESRDLVLSRKPAKVHAEHSLPQPLQEHNGQQALSCACSPTSHSVSFTDTGTRESQGRPESQICDSITGVTKGSTGSLLSIDLRPLKTGFGQ